MSKISATVLPQATSTSKQLFCKKPVDDALLAAVGIEIVAMAATTPDKSGNAQPVEAETLGKTQPDSEPVDAEAEESVDMQYGRREWHQAGSNHLVPPVQTSLLDEVIAAILHGCGDESNYSGI